MDKFIEVKCLDLDPPRWVNRDHILGVSVFCSKIFTENDSVSENLKNSTLQKPFEDVLDAYVLGIETVNSDCMLVETGDDLEYLTKRSGELAKRLNRLDKMPPWQAFDSN